MLKDLAIAIIHGDYVAALETLEDMTPQDYAEVDHELKVAVQAQDIEKSTMILRTKYPDVYKTVLRVCIRVGCGCDQN